MADNATSDADDKDQSKDTAAAELEVLRKIKTVLEIGGDVSPLAVLRAALEKLESVLGEAPDDENEANSAIAASVREVLELAPDAGKNEIILAMTTRGTGADAALAAMRESEADRLAKERVDEYVKGNVLNPFDERQMHAAMSLAKENPDQFEALLSRATPIVPPGRTTPPSSRQILIVNAESDWKGDPRMQAACSCEAAINLALREAGMKGLSEDEKLTVTT